MYYGYTHNIQVSISKDKGLFFIQTCIFPQMQHDIQERLRKSNRNAKRKSKASFAFFVFVLQKYRV